MSSNETTSTTGRHILRIAAALAAVGAAFAATAQESAPLPEARLNGAVAQLDGFAADALAAGIPGLAIAVVRDGEVLHLKGYGVRTAGGSEPVTPETVFQIASLSKSIAATVVAQQVGAGVVEWDTRVQDHLPWFELADPWVSAHVTIADFFSHRSGLPPNGGDDLEDLGYDRREVLERLRDLPLAPFRASYNYTNFGLTAAAEAVAVASGMDWADLCETVLYGPLRMSATSSRFSDFLARENRAHGHAKVDGTFTPITQRAPDAQSPAGGVSSNVVDLSRWMNVVMDEGMLDGAQVVDMPAFTAAATPKNFSRPSQSPATLPGFYGYGIGVSVEGSHVTLSHSGAFVLGAATAYAMVPGEKLGIVVLTNAAPIGAAETIVHQFTDLALFGEATRDWAALLSGAFAHLTDPMGATLGETPPTDAAPENLAPYVGVYENPYFGPATVSREADGLTLTLGPAPLTFALTPWSQDTFTFPIFTESAPHGSVSTARFTPDASGTMETLDLELFNTSNLGHFQRAPN